jgi:hypothetical protein
MTYEGTDIPLPRWTKFKHKGKKVNQDRCVKNFNPKKGGRFTCLDCLEENTCNTLLAIRLWSEKNVERM